MQFFSKCILIGVLWIQPICQFTHLLLLWIHHIEALTTFTKETNWDWQVFLKLTELYLWECFRIRVLVNWACYCLSHSLSYMVHLMVWITLPLLVKSPSYAPNGINCSLRTGIFSVNWPGFCYLSVSLNDLSSQLTMNSV
jgi:hypothetical protein